MKKLRFLDFLSLSFDFRPQPATNWYRTVNQLIKLHSSEACKLTKSFVFFFGSKIRVFVCSRCSNWGPKDGNGYKGVVAAGRGGGSGCERGHVTSSLGTCCLLRPKFLLIFSKHGSSRKVSRWFIACSCFCIIDQNKRRRVQRVDSAILRINLYLLDNAICFPDTYPLDSDIRWMALTIWPQLFKTVNSE